MNLKSGFCSVDVKVVTCRRDWCWGLFIWFGYVAEVWGDLDFFSSPVCWKLYSQFICGHMLYSSVRGVIEFGVGFRRIFRVLGMFAGLLG